MIIGNVQYSKLNDTILEKFVTEVCRLIHTHYETLLKTDDDRKNTFQIVLKQIKRVRNDFNIHKKKNLYQFILLSFQNRILYEAHYPVEVNSILKWPDRDEDRKLEALKLYFG